MTNDAQDSELPPKAVLYAFYALLVIVLIATLAIVGAYI
jgi:hypothetical protein